MQPDILGIIGPQAIFFVAFFLAFTLLEIILILILNKLELSSWKFMIDVIIRSEVEHGKVIKWLVILWLIIVAGLFAYFTPIIDVLLNASREMQYFAVSLLVVMAVVYWTTARKLTRLSIEKKIHKYLYALVSLIFFVVIVLVMNQSYKQYQKYVNETFINPTVQNVQIQMEESRKQRLLSEFRVMAQAGECSPVDYTQEGRGQVLNFVLIEHDPEFAESSDAVDPDDPQSFLQGRECSNGEESFLITPFGNWYWVIEN